MAGPLTIGAGVGPWTAAVPRPSGFAWAGAPTVRQVAPRRFELALDERSLLVPVTRAVYVDGASGNDANTGLSAAQAKKSISAALNLWGVAQTIYVKSGWYPVARSYTGGVPFGGDVNLIAVDSLTDPRPGSGQVTSSVSEDVTAMVWTDLGGGVWSAPLASAPYAVVDRATATPTWFTACAAAVDVNVPGEYHYGAGTLTVATTTGAQPGALLRVLRDAVHNGWLNTSRKMTVVGVTFEGGGNLRGFFAQDCDELTFVDSGFELSEGEGFGLQTAVAAATHNVRHIRSVARWNTLDGIQYTANGAGTSYRAVEYDVRSVENGRTGGANQGSTGHWVAGNADHYIQRVGGLYAGNEAQEVSDACGVGVIKVWMAGCQLDGVSVAGNGYELSGTGTAWLDHVRIDRVVNPLVTDAAGGTIHRHAVAQAGTSGPGTFDYYTPS